MPYKTPETITKVAEIAAHESTMTTQLYGGVNFREIIKIRFDMSSCV